MALDSGAATRQRLAPTPETRSEIAVEIPDPDDVAAADHEDTQPAPGDERRICLVDDCIAWSHQLPGDEFPSLAETGDPIVLSRRGGAELSGSEADATGGDRAASDYGVISVLDATTGVVRWRQTVGLTTSPSRPPSTASVDDQLLVMDGPDRLRSFELHNGEPRWESAVEDAAGVSQAGLAGKSLLVVLAPLPGAGIPEQRVLGVEPETGRQQWTSAAARRIALTEAGPVLFDPLSGAMWGLDPNDGSERWSKPLDRPPDQVGGVGTMIVVQHHEASVIDVATGTNIATLPSQPETPHMQPAPNDERGLVVLDARAVSHIAPDGSIWTKEVSGCCLASMADAEVVTVLLSDGGVRRFARPDGRTLDPPQSGLVQGPTGEPADLVGGYLVSLQGTRASPVLADPETLRPTVQLGEHIPLGTTTTGTTLLGAKGELAALRPPDAFTP